MTMIGGGGNNNNDSGGGLVMMVEVFSKIICVCVCVSTCFRFSDGGLNSHYKEGLIDQYSMKNTFIIKNKRNTI